MKGSLIEIPRDISKIQSLSETGQQTLKGEATDNDGWVLKS